MVPMTVVPRGGSVRTFVDPSEELIQLIWNGLEPITRAAVMGNLESKGIGLSLDLLSVGLIAGCVDSAEIRVVKCIPLSNKVSGRPLLREWLLRQLGR